MLEPSAIEQKGQALHTTRQRARADAERPPDAPTTAGEDRCPANRHRKPCGAAQAHRQRSDTLCAIDATARRERSLRGEPT